jgi:hypothetical protein
MYSGELEGRDEDAEAGRGGSGEVAVAKSSVATSSGLPAGAPHAEQKRPVAGTSVPQDEQAAMNFPIQSNASARNVVQEYRQCVP